MIWVWPTYRIKYNVGNFTLWTELLLCQALDLIKNMHTNEQIFDISIAPKLIFISVYFYSCETNVLNRWNECWVFNVLVRFIFKETVYKGSFEWKSCPFFAGVFAGHWRIMVINKKWNSGWINRWEIASLCCFHLCLFDYYSYDIFPSSYAISISFLVNCSLSSTHFSVRVFIFLI